MLKVNYNLVKTEKIKEKKRIVLIADIHLWDNYDNKLISNILNKVNGLKPDYICVCGDIINEFRYLNISSNQNFLMSFLNALAFVAPTIITLGSHDFMNQKMLKTGNISRNSINYWKKMIKDNNNPNLIFFDNGIYEDLNIRIISYTASNQYYKTEDKEILIQEINKNINDIDDNKVNVFMCHSPYRFNIELLSKLNIGRKLDLILSGHMHDGLVFPIFKNLPSSIGLISPDRKFFSRKARGRITFKLNGKKIVLVVTGGVLKFSNTAPKFLKKFNFLYNNDIDCIDIDK